MISRCRHVRYPHRARLSSIWLQQPPTSRRTRTSSMREFLGLSDRKYTWIKWKCERYWRRPRHRDWLTRWTRDFWHLRMLFLVEVKLNFIKKKNKIADDSWQEKQTRSLLELAGWGSKPKAKVRNGIPTRCFAGVTLSVTEKWCAKREIGVKCAVGVYSPSSGQKPNGL